MDLAIPQNIIDLIKALAALGFGSGLASLIASGLIASSFPAKAKEVIAFLVCVIGSFVMVLATGIDYTNLVVVVPAMILAAQVFYRKFFKPVGLASWIETFLITDKS